MAIITPDEFVGPALAGQWTFEDPVGGTASIVDGRLRVTCPPGVDADMWTSNTDAPHVWAPASDVDGDIYWRWDLPPEHADTEGHDLLVRESATRFLRILTYRPSANNGNLLIATVDGGSASTRFQSSYNSLLPGNGGAPAAYHRLNRTGDTWTVWTSHNGYDWTEVVSFTWTATVSSVAVAAVSGGDNPGADLRLAWLRDTYTAPPDRIEDRTGLTPITFPGSSGDPWPATDWTIDHLNGGTTEQTGTGTALLTVPDVDGGAARVRLNAAQPSRQGLVFRFKLPSAPGSAYFVAGIRSSADFGDFYGTADAYTIEMPEDVDQARMFRVVHAPAHPLSPPGENYDDVYLSLSDPDAKGVPNGSWCWLRFECVDEQIRARTWADGSPEPSTWDHVALDGTLTGTGYASLGFAVDDESGAAGPDASVEIADLTTYTFPELAVASTSSPIEVASSPHATRPAVASTVSTIAVTSSPNTTALTVTRAIASTSSPISVVSSPSANWPPPPGAVSSTTSPIVVASTPTLATPTVPPRVAATRTSRFELLAADLVTGEVVDQVPYRTLRFGAARNRAADFQAELPGEQIPPTTIQAARTVLYVVRDGQIIADGIVWLPRFDDGILTVMGSSMWSYYHARRVRRTVTFDQVDQAALVADLLGLAAPDGIGVDVDTVPTGRLRDRTYPGHERKPVAEAVEQLAAVSDGFDFRLAAAFNARGDVDRTFRIRYPDTGRRTGYVFDDRIPGHTIGAYHDGAAAANRVDFVGQGEGDAMVTATAVAADAIGPYPALEDVLVGKDVSRQATAAGHARAEVDARGTPPIVPTVTVAAGTDPAVGSVTPGDLVTVRADRGWLQLDGLATVTSWECVVSDDDPGTVTYTLEALQ